METMLGLILVLMVLGGAVCLLFLVCIQPIWSLVDVAVSKQHSGGTKAAVILLTLLLLGPVMPFFYACFGTRSRVLRGSTLISLIVLIVCGGSTLGLAIAVPALKQKWPWGNTSAAIAKSPESALDSLTPEAATNLVDPETVPPFTAVHLGHGGAARWVAAIAEFNGHGPNPQSALPVALPDFYPLTHLAVDPQGPAYYGITTHEVGRIDSATGRFEAFKSPASGAKLSWPSALAFDSKQGLLLIAARSTGFSFNPKTGAWQELPWLKDDGLVALAYDPGREQLYALQRDSGSKVAANLLQFNARGAQIKRTLLSNPIPVGDYPAPMAQLALAGDNLVSIVHASPEQANASVTTGVSLFIIDPQSGECRTVRP